MIYNRNKPDLLVASKCLQTLCLDFSLVLQNQRTNLQLRSTLISEFQSSDSDGGVGSLCLGIRIYCDSLHYCDFVSGNQWGLNNTESCKWHWVVDPFCLSFHPMKVYWMMKQNDKNWMHSLLVFTCIPKPKNVTCGF